MIRFITIAAAAPLVIALGQDVAAQSANASAGLGAAGIVQPPAPASVEAYREQIRSVVGHALEEGRSEEYIDALVNEAAAEGKLYVADDMLTPDGRVDTASLLATLEDRAPAAEPAPAADAEPARAAAPERAMTPADVAQTVAALETEAEPAAPEPEPAAEPEAASPAPAPSPADSGQLYVVVAGDSLSSIAERFYGDPLAFDRLFAANRDVLANPNQISPGQRIRIPR